jgi:hypothetical protein
LAVTALTAILNLEKVKISFSLDKPSTELARQGNTT